MSTRPFAKADIQRLRDAAELGVHHLKRAEHSLTHSLARIDVPRPLPAAVDLPRPGRVVIGALAGALPLLVMAAVERDVAVTAPGILVLVAVAFATYLTDWAGGVAALASAALGLHLVYIGDPLRFDRPSAAGDAFGLIAVLLAGAGLVCLIHQMKRESDTDRQAAIAARAAATALTAVEAATAVHARHSQTGRKALHGSLLRAMISINRAHAGVLFLADPATNELATAASYGLDGVAGRVRAPRDLCGPLVDLVVTERRARSFANVETDPRTEGGLLRAANVRAALAVPLIDGEDRLLGVAVVGLFVPHRFTPIEIARVRALADRAAAVVEAAHGIDERETALHSAREAMHWLELVIAAMPEAVVLAMPPDGHIVAQNQAAIDLLGRVTGPDLLGDIATRLRLPDGEACCGDALPIQQAFTSGEVVAGVELVAFGPDGREVPVLVSAAPVHDGDDGPVAAVVAVFRDIAALKEASRLKDEFVSVVSHELRSPLTPIRGFVQLVAKDLAREGGHDPQVSRLNSIAGHVDRMTRLVDDLLDVSRLKSGSLEIRKAPVDLVELCTEVVQARLAASSGHQIVLAPGPAELTGDFDADRLYQVVDNLVGNAVKYSPLGGTIRVGVGTERSTGAATITVADDGPGIPAEDQERVFSAFYRTRAAAAGQVAGLGLGLYICHELVAAHGGTIRVADAPGGRRGLHHPPPQRGPGRRRVTRPWQALPAGLTGRSAAAVAAGARPRAASGGASRRRR